jgi:hypothetical protein
VFYTLYDELFETLKLHKGKIYIDESDSLAGQAASIASDWPKSILFKLLLALLPV